MLFIFWFYHILSVSTFVRHTITFFMFSFSSKRYSSVTHNNWRSKMHVQFQKLGLNAIIGSLLQKKSNISIFNQFLCCILCSQIQCQRRDGIWLKLWPQNMHVNTYRALKNKSESVNSQHISCTLSGLSCYYLTHC